MLEVLGLAFLALACWRLLRRFFYQTTLDNIPGPSPRSFWAGEQPSPPVMHLITYHELKGLYVNYGVPEDGILLIKWSKLVSILPNALSICYLKVHPPHIDGSVIKVKGPLGVSNFDLLLASMSLNDVPEQYIIYFRSKGSPSRSDKGGQINFIASCVPSHCRDILYQDQHVYEEMQSIIE